MSLASILALSLLPVLVFALIVRLQRWQADRVIRALGVVALAANVVIGLLVWRSAWADSGTFAGALVGIPVICSALVVVAPDAGRFRGPLSSAAAAVTLVWSVLTGVGLGLYFLLPALLLLAAAAVALTAERPAQG